jgi:hypothetical protein
MPKMDEFEDDLRGAFLDYVIACHREKLAAAQGDDPKIFRIVSHEEACKLFEQAKTQAKKVIEDLANMRLSENWPQHSWNRSDRGCPRSASCAPDALCRTVTALSALRRRTVELHEHSVINISTERALNGLKIGSVAIAG